MPGLQAQMLVLGGAWMSLAALDSAAEGPRLRYDPRTFLDECLAPDFGGLACAREPGAEEEDRLSASAALLPADARQPETPRLRYEMEGLAALDGAVTYWQPRTRPDR
jgi:hypothetical protein